VQSASCSGQNWPHYPFDRVETAFRDFERLFNGQFPGYYGCDTVYHDLQHSLDGTLAVARLIVSYDRTHLADERLGPERAIVGVVTALFHDAGYIRQTDDQTHRNGAEFTLSHVSRSAALHQAATCRPSAWPSGCRWQPRSCTSPATKCSSTRSVSTIIAIASSVT
jgi:hypothetical protein